MREGEKMIQEITNTDFNTEVLESKLPVIADFYADWCAPCRMLSYLVEDLAYDYRDRLKVVKINIDSSEAIAAEYNIMSVPTLVLFVNGKETKKIVGFHTKEQIKALFNIEEGLIL